MTAAAEKEKRIIYLAATPSDAAKGIFKVGETYNLDRRMGELSGTAHYEKYKPYKTWNEDDCPYSDKVIHSILKRMGIKRMDRGREFFHFGTVEEAIRVVNEAITGKKKLFNYPEREEQTRIIEEVCRNFQTSKDAKKVHLIDAKMRAGKCHITYKVALRMNFRRVLIMSSKPSGVCSSWRGDIDHVAFGDFEFRSAHEMDDVCFHDDDGTQVIFVSTQDCIGEEGNKEKFHALFEQSFDMVVIDECHHGGDTERLNDFLSRLQYTHELHLSGTAFKAKRSGKFGLHQISTWTYLDEQKKRKMEENYGWKTEVYRGLPVFSGYIATYDDTVIESFRKQYREEEMPTCYKMFSNEKCIEDFLGWVISDRHMGERVTNHMFWLLPGIDHCNKMEKVLRRHPMWSQYVVVNASGDNVKDLSDAKSNVYNHEAKTITLSCGRWNTGSTVEQWDSVWLLEDGYSPEVYFQTIFRAGSPYVKGGKFLKERVHFVDFNPDRSLEFFYTYASCYANGNSNAISNVRSLLDFMPLYRVNALGINTLKYEELLEHFNSPEFSSNLFRASSLLDVGRLNDTVREILQNIEKNQPASVKVSLNADSQGRGKNHVGIPIAKTPSKKEDDWWGKRAETILLRFTSLLFVLDTIVIRDVRDLENHAEEFERHVGITFGDFLGILDSGYVVEEKLNEQIGRFNLQNEFLFA